MSRDLGYSAPLLESEGHSLGRPTHTAIDQKTAQLPDAPGHRASRAILQRTSSHTIISSKRYPPPSPTPACDTFALRTCLMLSLSPKPLLRQTPPPVRIVTGLANITIFQNLHPLLPYLPLPLTPLTISNHAHLFFVPAPYYKNLTPLSLVGYNSTSPCRSFHLSKDAFCDTIIQDCCSCYV